MSNSPSTDLVRHCHELRALHRPGDPLVLPNVWDVTSARAVVDAGYGLAPDDIVRRLVAIGAAGANIEDTDYQAGGLRSIDDQVELLGAVRSAADSMGIPVVINARVDSFVADRGRNAGANLADAVERSNAYLAAGADCVYPIFLSDPTARDTFIADVDGAVNLVTRPGAMSIDELAAAGVARVSYGPTLHMAAMAALRDALAAIRSAEMSP